MDMLAEWLRLAEVRIQLMDEAVGFVTDSSAVSLAALQGELESLDDEERLGAAAYLGESLLAAGGGEWAWDEAARQPIVVPGPSLGVPAVAPIDEIDDASGETDGRLATLLRAWAAAAGAGARTAPGTQTVTPSSAAGSGRANGAGRTPPLKATVASSLRA